MRALTVRGWGTLGALLVLVAVVVATASATFSSRRPPQAPSIDQVVLANNVDRCDHGGEAAEADPACQAAWRRSSEQFLRVRSPGVRP
jgi:conjugative transfer region protein TrbK